MFVFDWPHRFIFLGSPTHYLRLFTRQACLEIRNQDQVDHALPCRLSIMLLLMILMVVNNIPIIGTISTFTIRSCVCSFNAFYFVLAHNGMSSLEIATYLEDRLLYMIAFGTPTAILFGYFPGAASLLLWVIIFPLVSFRCQFFWFRLVHNNGCSCYDTCNFWNQKRKPWDTKIDFVCYEYYWSSTTFITQFYWFQGY